ncbi:MAG: IclR family transcriptional regulator [Deltaproteobacteria bacterium]|jgi:DNA-binding IclR family transcriptional regulator|nr:IclR family transcriptional regulator [Deltaproteobacteria bacterium]
MNKSDDKYIMTTVETALSILEAITEFNDGFNLGELAEKVGISKSKTYRYIETLKKRGYITRTNVTKKYNSKYHVGLSAYETGCKLMSKMDLHKKAKPIMEELVRTTQETVYLVIAKYDKILFLDKVETNQKVHTLPFTGKYMAIDSTAAGLVIRAQSEDDSLPPSELLKVIRDDGWCFDTDVLAHGVSSLAAPVLNENGTVFASLCIVAPAYRLNSNTLQNSTVPAQLCEAAERISCNMGYRNHHLLDSYKPLSPNSQISGIGYAAL